MKIALIICLMILTSCTSTQEPFKNKLSTTSTFMSVSPISMEVPNRPVDIQMRVSAPITGSKLPVILFSHGHGHSNYLSSMLGCAPLANYWASHGFVVIQPTHLDSKTLNLDPNGPEGPAFWHSRVKDMKFILDHLDEIESNIPFLKGRLDKNKIAAVGYSLGGYTTAMLLGMQTTNPNNGEILDLSDTRIKAGVLMAAPGNGNDLNPNTAKRYPFLRHSNFETMTTPALIVNGDKDVNPLFTNRSDWRADPYTLSNGSKCLLTVFGAEHSLGGIVGYDALETSDENTETVAFIQELTWSYLRTALYPEDTTWKNKQKLLKDSSNPLGRVDSK